MPASASLNAFSDLLALLAATTLLNSCSNETGGTGSARDATATASASDQPTPSDQPPPSEQPSPSEEPPPTGSPPYEFPTDGSGPATEPFDQPTPIPSPFWDGWIDQRSGICEWIPNVLARQIGWAGDPPETGAGCAFRLTNGDSFQVTWWSSYSWIDPGYDSWHFMRPVHIAGPEGREYSMEAAEPDDCQVALNSRAVTSLMVEVYDGERELAHSREQRCATARRAAKLIAERFIPLAGGTVWSKTRQSPTVAALKGKDACNLVDKTVRAQASVYDAPARRGAAPNGPTCIARDGATTISALVTKGPRMGSLKRHRSTVPRSRHYRQVH